MSRSWFSAKRRSPSSEEPPPPPSPTFLPYLNQYCSFSWRQELGKEQEVWLVWCDTAVKIWQYVAKHVIFKLHIVRHYNRITQGACSWRCWNWPAKRGNSGFVSNITVDSEPLWPFRENYHQESDFGRNNYSGKQSYVVGWRHSEAFEGTDCWQLEDDGIIFFRNARNPLTQEQSFTSLSTWLHNNAAERAWNLDNNILSVLIHSASFLPLIFFHLFFLSLRCSHSNDCAFRS
jgi:hypothetical protein